MESLVIRIKDVDRLGKKLLKDVYDFFQDDDVLSFFHMKEEKRKFLNYFLFERIGSEFDIQQELDESKYEKELESVKKDIEEETFDIEQISWILNDLNFDMELDEDLYFKVKAFLNLYSVFDSDYLYLDE